MAGPGSPSTTLRNVDGKGCPTMKFLCSYGGKILPYPLDGKLRYVGGETRVISIDRSLSFSELAAKLSELCGETGSVIVRCQLPTDDLDSLISITSDEELRDLIEEYDRFNRDRPFSLKIRSFLWPRSVGVKAPASHLPSVVSANPQDAGKLRKPKENRFIPLSSGFLPRIRPSPRIRSHHCHHHLNQHPIFVHDRSESCPLMKPVNPAIRYYTRRNPF